MTILSELQYPIGRFQWSGANTPTDRERMIAVIESIPGRYLDAVAGLTDTVEYAVSRRRLVTTAGHPSCAG